MTSYIFLAGEIKYYDFLADYDLKNGVSICADGGYAHAERLGILPDYIVGDMDSVDEGIFPAESKIIRYPTDKDYTDGQLAVKLAAEIGCDEIVIFGALANTTSSLNRGESSGRFDHVLGNIYLLKYAQSLGVAASSAEADCEIILIDKFAEIERRNFKYISLLPFTPIVKGITLTGMKYSLDNGSITQSDFQTMSNEFAIDIATVSVEEGELLAVMTL